MRKIAITAVGLFVCLCWPGWTGPRADVRSAQVSASRWRGGPARGMEEQEDVGTLQGNERFLRQNRRDVRLRGPRHGECSDSSVRCRPGLGPDARLHAGSDAPRGSLRTVNQPLPPARRGTLTIRGWTSVWNRLRSPDTTLAAQRALETLARSPQLSGTSRIAVSVAGRTAILQGEVPSAADRELAEILLTFEPGISAIQNELQVNPLLQETEDSLSAMRERQAPRETWKTLSHGARSQRA